MLNVRDALANHSKRMKLFRRQLKDVNGMPKK
jgi:hypothetical protein